MENLEKNNSSIWLNFLAFLIATATVCISAGLFIPSPAVFVSEFGRSNTDVIWTALFYPIGAAACAPIVGKLADIIGRRKTLLFGSVVFTIGQAIAGFAPTFWVIVFARLVTGIGAAAIMPCAAAHIAVEFPDEKKGIGFSVFTLVSCASTVFGPIIGGLLINEYGWRSTLIVGAVLGAITFVLCIILSDKTPFVRTNNKKFDFAGGGLVFVIFTSLLLLPNFGQTAGWTSPIVLGFGAAILIGIIALYLIEKKVENPVISFKFIARKNFIIPVVILFLTQGLMQSNITTTILYVKDAQQGNMALAGMATSILFFGMSIGSIIIGPMSDKIQPKILTLFSLFVTGIGVTMQFLYTATAPFYILALSLGLLGLGLGGNASVFLKVIMDGMDPQEAGSGSGTYSVFRDVTAPFGVAVFVTMFGTRSASKAAELISSGIGEQLAISDAMTSTMKYIGVVQMACVVLAMILCLFIPKIAIKNKYKEPSKNEEAI